MDEFSGSPETWPPLGLPQGSVRALLTLVVMAVVVSNLAQGRETDVLWVQALLVAMAHYFATRRRVALPGEVLARLEQEHIIRTERHPLYLPRYSIRLIIVATFVSLAVYLQREGKLYEPRTLALLGMIFAYLFGVLSRGVVQFIQRNRQTPPHRLWADLRALGVLAAVIIAALPEFFDSPYHMPHELLTIALGLVLFYFGMR
ncbi:MAG: hypothetical protein SFV23_27010 [Planctomycetaceae bacterium]|nr:hypothetical protein [Planctomycetaceae bacterium]